MLLKLGILAAAALIMGSGAWILIDIIVRAAHRLLKPRDGDDQTGRKNVA